MSKRRKLTEAEKAEIGEKVREAVEAAMPDHTFVVYIEDWTNDDGEPLYRINDGTSST